MEFCAEQRNGEQHSNKMQTHDKAESLRIPIAAEYVKQDGIDNCAATAPEGNHHGNNVSLPVPKQRLNYKRPALHETTCSLLCLRLQCLAAL